MARDQQPEASPSPRGTDSTSSVPSEPHSIFDERQKSYIVFIVSIAATFSGFASNIYFPALPTIARDLDVSIELVNLTITSYLIFQGLAPSLWGPISDVKGRRVAYTYTFIVFLGACIGLAETRNYTTLIILRCLQSTGSASTIAIGSGVIGDITTRADRGSYMGVFQAGLLAPVAIGPVIGGALAGSLGWRSIFCFLAIYSVIFLLCLLLFLPETLRSIVGNGSLLPSTFFGRYPLNVYQRLSKEKQHRTDTHDAPPTKHIDFTGPFRILISKQAAPIIFFIAIYYAVWQMSLTARSTIFEQSYHLSETQVGLTFIANGVGSIIGTLVTGKILDFDYRRVKAKTTSTTPPTDIEAGNNTPVITPSKTNTLTNPDIFPLEKARLRLLPLFSTLQILSILLFGWSTQYTLPLAIPITATFIHGWFAVSAQSTVMTYLVDIFSDRGDSAAASASLNLARCLLAAGGTSVVGPLMDGVGVGWAFTLCVVGQVLALGLLGVQWRFGARWRVEGQVYRK